jgi:hypothetical protein
MTRHAGSGSRYVQGDYWVAGGLAGRRCTQGDCWRATSKRSIRYGSKGTLWCFRVLQGMTLHLKLSLFRSQSQSAPDQVFGKTLTQ